MSEVAVILPCRGRHEQTITYAAQLRAAAGAVDVEWWAVGGPDERPTLTELERAAWRVLENNRPLSYWRALDLALGDARGAIICAVANDVWAQEGWLANGLAAYRARFADGEGLMGFAGDGHPPEHSCHFLIGRGLLFYLGGWPVHYHHNFGDAELCLRAQQLGRYGKATHAVLEHRHVWAGAAPDDAVYQAGRARWAEDQSLFEARKARNWV